MKPFAFAAALFIALAVYFGGATAQGQPPGQGPLDAATVPDISSPPAAQQEEAVQPAAGGEDQQPIAIASSNSNATTTPKCGTVENDFAPCVPKERADALFKHCCEQYAPEGCQPLCQYESDEQAARSSLLEAVKSGKCELKHMSTVLYCASQNQDNRKCCAHLNLADPKLGVGDRCLRFCDPAGDGIQSITRSDVTCLFNWNVLLYCAHSGIKAE